MLEVGEVYKASEVSKKTFAEWARLCNEDGTKHIDLIDGYYYVKANDPIPESVLLEDEKRVLEQWLRDHDYIGIKIATGRANVDEYAEEIEEMKRKAERINEIDRLLASDSVID